jgi:putative transposase
MEIVLSRCRLLCNAALEQRKIWWQRGQSKSATYHQQAMELPELKTVWPEYAEINALVLQDVLRRLDKTFQAFFRRARAGGPPGYPRFQGRGRYNIIPYPQYGVSIRSMESAPSWMVVHSLCRRLDVSAFDYIDHFKAHPRL